MKTKSIKFLTIFLVIVGFVSCKKNNPNPTDDDAISGFSKGVFVTNEGPFGSGSGSVSFFSRDSIKAYNNIFEVVNNTPLGNIVQSINIHSGKAYIVVNNAGKVVVADAGSFLSKGQINNLYSPRYFLGINSQIGYVSEYGSDGMTGAVRVIDLNNNTIIDSIPTGKGANTMLKSGGYVYVACNGGYDSDSVVSVIDLNTNQVVKNIVTAANPSELVMDVDGNIWVLCFGRWDAGYTALEKTGSLVKINGTTKNVELILPFSSLYSQPSGLCINAAKNRLYYNYDGSVYAQDISATSLSNTVVINRNFYGLGVDPESDYIFATDPGDYISNGKVLRYNPAGIVIDSFTVGIIPNGFYFN